MFCRVCEGIFLLPYSIVRIGFTLFAKYLTSRPSADHPCLNNYGLWLSRNNSIPLRIYYGTDTRAAGFLVGAMLVPICSPGQARHTSGIGIFEALGWGGWLVLVIFYDQFNEFQFFLYRGGILVTALATALLIIGASNPVTSSSKLPEMPAVIFINIHPPTGWEYYVNEKFVEGVAR
jgi:hypothetical protein